MEPAIFSNDDIRRINGKDILAKDVYMQLKIDNAEVALENTLLSKQEQNRRLNIFIKAITLAQEENLKLSEAQENAILYETF